MKKLFPILSLLAVFLIGLGVLLYPTVANWLFEKNATLVLNEYAQMVQSLPPYDKEEQLRLAREYNGALTGQDIKDPFVPGSGIVLPDNYTSVLDIGGAMGYVNIPKISVNLPIRHGTSDEVLEESIGHIEATAFPIGGESTHCVLTGHRGNANAKLFTDLDLIGEGDVFFLTVMEDTICYQVDQILVVEPEEVAGLKPVPGEDYCTLITCTPLGINSHRLLVRGVRVPYDVEELPEEILEKLEQTAVDWRGLIIIGFAALWTVFLAVSAISEHRRAIRWNRR